jgi:hypothetical protein
LGRRIILELVDAVIGNDAPVDQLEIVQGHACSGMQMKCHAWHASCFSGLMMMVLDTDQAWLFVLIAGALGACFIWAFWEIEEARRRRLQIKGSANRPARGRRPEF